MYVGKKDLQYTNVNKSKQNVFSLQYGDLMPYLKS